METGFMKSLNLVNCNSCRSEAPSVLNLNQLPESSYLSVQFDYGFSFCMKEGEFHYSPGNDWNNVETDLPMKRSAAPPVVGSLPPIRSSKLHSKKPCKPSPSLSCRKSRTDFHTVEVCSQKEKELPPVSKAKIQYARSLSTSVNKDPGSDPHSLVSEYQPSLKRTQSCGRLEELNLHSRSDFSWPKLASLKRAGSWRYPRKADKCLQRNNSFCDISSINVEPSLKERWDSLRRSNKGNKQPQVKKVSTPTVPKSFRFSSGSCGSSGYGSTSSYSDRISSSSVEYDRFSSPSHYIDENSVFGGNDEEDDMNSDASSTTYYWSSNSQYSTLERKGQDMLTQPVLQHVEDQGIDLTQSPGRESPSSSGSIGSSSGCRNSTTSLDSGRASSTLYEIRSINGYTPSQNPNRLSGHSCSSGSSQSSYDRLEEVSGCISQVHLAELLSRGMPDHEVLALWLRELHFEEYHHLFVRAGYDLPTITLMTPQDLSSIGIVKPAHRKKLKSEISKLQLSDGLPDYIPESLEDWLRVLHLEEYYPSLCQQGYKSIDAVTDLTWEDLEDIGISKLGHQKKLLLAIKRVRDIVMGKRFPPLSPKYSSPCGAQEIAISRPTNMTPDQQVCRMQTFHAPSPAPSTPHRYQLQCPVDHHQRRKSLESLHQEDRYPTYVGPPQIDPNWKCRSYEDGDITPTNEVMVVYDGGGGGTLPRLRTSCKPKPVAKIIAKTRPLEPESRSVYIEDRMDMFTKTHPECSPHGDKPLPPQWQSSFISSPQRRFSTGLKSPPPPPKRCNSIGQCDEIPHPNYYASIHPSLGLSSKNVEDEVIDPQHDPDCPPLPPPFTAKLETVARCGGYSRRVNPEVNEDYEVTFRDRHHSTNSSFKSTSSTDSESLPFANENSGTIKQKVSRTYEVGNVANVVPMKVCRGQFSGHSPQQSESDVLGDIGTMLADLTTELDAMLEYEAKVHSSP